MKTKLLPFSRLPSRWITDGGLKAFKWSARDGANSTAALLVLAVIVHHADQAGLATLTYDQLTMATGISRS